MSRSLRYAIVGAGMMGHEHIRNLELVEGAEVVAIADPHSESRWWSQQVSKHELAEFTDVDSLLAGASIDAVIVASPNHTHREVLTPLFDTDLAIFCEKPHRARPSPFHEKNLLPKNDHRIASDTI